MSFLVFLQAILSVLLIFCVLLQQRAAGITATFGGMNAPVVQRRGAEKLLYQMTVVSGVAFIVLTLLQWYV